MVSLKLPFEFESFDGMLQRPQVRSGSSAHLFISDHSSSGDQLLLWTSFDRQSTMAEAGIVGIGSQPITELPPDVQERHCTHVLANAEHRRSATSGKTQPLVSAAHGDIAKKPNQVDIGKESWSQISETVLEQKQSQGETVAEGGDTQWYKPIDTYEGRHRWDPNAEWTEAEERRIVRKVRQTKLLINY